MATCYRKGRADEYCFIFCTPVTYAIHRAADGLSVCIHAVN